MDDGASLREWMRGFGMKKVKFFAKHQRRVVSNLTLRLADRHNAQRNAAACPLAACAITTHRN